MTRKLHFCTLFDSAYFSRGLAMYQSLKETCAHFDLYILCFDDATYKTLVRLNLEQLIPIRLQDFEDPRLLEIKPSRSRGEYCWTCTPSIILYVLQKYNVPDCTYVDADLYFFSDPTVLLEEMGNKDVLITEHRYTPKYDQTEKSGKYCVQFINFRNTANGLSILNWWRDRCIEWCFARFEEGRFGDQKYLDDWTTRFTGVHELQHLGGGVAPWNVQQYRIFPDAMNRLQVNEINTSKTYTLVFYHFHYFTFITDSLMNLGPYKINESAREFIYKPYIKALDKAESLKEKSTSASHNNLPKIKRLKIYLKALKYYQNVFNKRSFLSKQWQRI